MMQKQVFSLRSGAWSGIGYTRPCRDIYISGMQRRAFSVTSAQRILRERETNKQTRSRKDFFLRATNSTLFSTFPRAFCDRIENYSEDPDMDLHYEDIVRLTKSKSIVLIDVRDPEELEETGVLPTSVNIPLDELESALGDISPEEFRKKYGFLRPGIYDPIVFSCRTGKRSRKALLIAQDLGYKNAKHYQGGYVDWVNNTEADE